MTSQDYRIFVGAFPTGELAETIQSVREHFDPRTARIAPPHVTLAGTYWRNGPATQANEVETINRLERLPGRLQPFALHLGGIRVFPGRHPIIYLGVAITPELLEARKLLLDLLVQDKHTVFNPHLTLAMRLPKKHAALMIRELKDSPWDCQSWSAPLDHLRLMQRGPRDSAWRRIHTIPLLD